MKVRVHPADLWGCGHYRLIWPAEALREQGYDVEIVRPGDSSGIVGTTIEGRLVDAQLEHDADVFVFQRATHYVLVQLIEQLRRKGKTVVIDMDDDLTSIHPKNVAFGMLHPRNNPQNNWQHAQRACQVASLVTVSTPELQRRYGFDRSRVLRNCVPRAFFSVEKPDVEPVWGWAGALHSHPDDLPIIGGAVNDMNSRGYKFKIVGYPDGTGRALGMMTDPDATGRIPFDRWADALAELAVGVAPLSDTRFNKAKSWLKPLEYAAVGVPWVASDRAEYRELQRLGAGFVVGDRTRDWTRAVRRLLDDDEFRRETGEQCREVARQAIIEEHAWRWMETWETAYQLDRGIRPATVA